MAHQTDALARAHQTAHQWLTVLAEELGTQDRHFTLRALRSWLHLVRDRLTVDAAVHLGAQLPETLRGVYYDGWEPRLVPIRYDADQFMGAYAAQVNLPPGEAPEVAVAVTRGLRRLFSPGQLEHVLARMPADLRRELEPGQGHGAVPTRSEQRLEGLEGKITILSDAVFALVKGLEEIPTEEPAEGRTARAAQDAHRILLAEARSRG